jgi:hypothetical protein
MKNNLDKMNFADLTEEELQMLKDTEEKFNKRRKGDKVFLMAMMQ